VLLGKNRTLETAGCGTHEVEPKTHTQQRRVGHPAEKLTQGRGGIARAMSNFEPGDLEGAGIEIDANDLAGLYG
jgi:hypothetical protein